MTAVEFIRKWKPVTLSEKAGCHSHFIDLCKLLGQPAPTDVDPEGTWYAFERGAQKSEGGHGWADVWKKGHFGWEYKKKRRDLKAAYDQLLQYREALENPPLLVVCDMDRFEIHTNFTDSVKKTYSFDLEGLADEKNIDILRKIFTDPEALKPGQTREAVTTQAAERFGQLADGLRVRGVESHRAAHFLMKLMFCMFAEDIELLKNHVFSKILETVSQSPVIGIPHVDAGKKLDLRLKDLFHKMSVGGWFGTDEILHFNGGLFADADTIELTPSEVQRIRSISELDWSNVEPSVFGTLFERILDPDKRSQLGAHYTSSADIETLLHPVVMQPLRREWQAVKEKCEEIDGELFWLKSDRAKRKKIKEREGVLREFGERLSHVTILDPACGSGNFLYVALRLLLDLEKEVIAFAARQGMGLTPYVRPTQLAGIEINPYAKELASVVIWIGYLQWKIQNGYPVRDTPVLDPLESIEQKDAILDLSNPEHPSEPEWPKAEFIVGNPPFLGGKIMRSDIGDAYVDALFQVWDGRVRPEADLCCYWFEKGRSELKRKRVSRVGLLGTQGIRGGANRDSLNQIKKSGDIFFAVSDLDWILDGANVHISMVGFDRGDETTRVLDGVQVATINANLTALTDVTQARHLDANADICFMGDTKGGAFDISDSIARQLLRSPNPHEKPNSDVITPWVNGKDVTQSGRRMWIIDFFSHSSLSDAACFEAAFRYAEDKVRPARESSRTTIGQWWMHERPRVEMRIGLTNLARFVCTTRVSKHRIFVWLSAPTLPDSATFVFARADDYFFGVLHSRSHEVWARAQGTQVRERESGFRYTPTTCFETFPFPEPSDAQREEIAEAARELDRLRSNWLNPGEWTRVEVLEFPGTVGGPWDRYIERGAGSLEQGAIGNVKYPRVVAKDAECEKLLKKRTLTNLYNERPTWLDLAHRRLDEAVFAAYGWDPGISEDELLAKLLELNLERAAAE